MNRAKKVDANQPEIVAGLRQLGASVQILSAVGDGCPDILVGWHGKNVLLEIKDEEQMPSKRKLTPDQEHWHMTWRGQVAVVKSLAEALTVLRKEGLS